MMQITQHESKQSEPDLPQRHPLKSVEKANHSASTILESFYLRRVTINFPFLVTPYSNLFLFFLQLEMVLNNSYLQKLPPRYNSFHNESKGGFIHAVLTDLDIFAFRIDSRDQHDGTSLDVPILSIELHCIAWKDVSNSTVGTGSPGSLINN